jgi:hypothetical protein
MALNFNDLPQDRPAGGQFPNITDKYCRAKVHSANASVSTGANTKGQDKLDIVFDCVSFDGTVTTKIWDSFYESEKPLLRYKLRQFILALGLKLQGEFTMRDLAKIVPNKELILATKTEDNTKGGLKNVVDAYDDGIFYPMSELANLKGEASEDGIPPFTAADGETPFDTTAAPTTTGSDQY